MKNNFIRSYGRTKTRSGVLKHLVHYKDYCVHSENISDFIKKSKKTYIEVGFGMGDRIYKDALNNIEINMIGFEPYLNGVNSLLRKLYENNITNVGVNKDDFREILPFIPENSIDKIIIMFPDPWPKKAHNKRRIISENFLRNINKIIKISGVIEIATDSDDYSNYIKENFGKFPKIYQVNYSFNQLPQNWIETKYYLRSMKLKHNFHYFEAILL